MATEPKVTAGALGPRLAGRLTAELILRSPQYMNCIGHYQVDLRASKIGAIENLGATENQFDSIDLSDNAIVKLEGFSKLHRLKTLLLSNNRISRVAKGLEASIPNLEVLVLTSNRVNNLQDIDPLSSLRKLSVLCLVDNPVTKKPHYRLYVVSKVPQVKVLDFRKVKQKERAEARRMFGSTEQSASHAANTFELDEEYQENVKKARTATEAEQTAASSAAVDPQQPTDAGTAGPTQEQLTAIKAAIANAKTLAEVRQLEESLRTGHMPSQFRFDKPDAQDLDSQTQNGAHAMDQG